MKRAVLEAGTLRRLIGNPRHAASARLARPRPGGARDQAADQRAGHPPAQGDPGRRPACGEGRRKAPSPGNGSAPKASGVPKFKPPRWAAPPPVPRNDCWRRGDGCARRSVSLPRPTSCRWAGSLGRCSSCLPKGCCATTGGCFGGPNPHSTTSFSLHVKLRPRPRFTRRQCSNAAGGADFHWHLRSRSLVCLWICRDVAGATLDNPSRRSLENGGNWHATEQMTGEAKQC